MYLVFNLDSGKWHANGIAIEAEYPFSTFVLLIVVEVQKLYFVRV